MENMEQPELDRADAQIQEEGSSDTTFGKFKDAESLLKAYTSLEAEFTKKSQKLKSLESESVKKEEELSRQAEIEKRVDEFVTKFDIAKPFSSALKESLASHETSLEDEAIRLISNHYKRAEDYINDSEFLNNYIFNNQSIRDTIVRDYLSKITQNSPIKMDTSSSTIPLTPPRMPTTIQEAGKLAKSIIKNK